jgi:hypothetical protein
MERRRRMAHGNRNPIILAAGNPGSRRWFIRDRGLSAGERWRHSPGHDLGRASVFRNRDQGTFAGTGIALGLGGLSDVARIPATIRCPRCRWGLMRPMVLS